MRYALSLKRLLSLPARTSERLWEHSCCLSSACIVVGAVKPGLQYTQETGAKPRDFARTQAKKCLQSMRVCLQHFPVCVTSQLVAQTTTESDHSFTVEFTIHKCTSTEENKMALACKKEGRIGFSFFVRCFVCAFFLSSFSFFSFFANSYCRENH